VVEPIFSLPRNSGIDPGGISEVSAPKSVVGGKRRQRRQDVSCRSNEGHVVDVVIGTYGIYLPKRVCMSLPSFLPSTGCSIRTTFDIEKSLSHRRETRPFQRHNSDGQKEVVTEEGVLTVCFWTFTHHALSIVSSSRSGSQSLFP
jgi:hypothetical protein